MIKNILLTSKKSANKAVACKDIYTLMTKDHLFTLKIFKQ